MWLCTQFGFYSIVQKKPGEFHVRARMKKDIENLCRACARAGIWKIHRSTPADYRWRLVIGDDDLALVMSTLSDSINYPNFKGRIHALADQRGKCNAYAGLWSALHRLQEAVGPRSAL